MKIVIPGGSGHIGTVVRIGLPASRWMLEVGTFFMRTETELILKSHRVVPTLLLERGFELELPTWREAAADLCRRATAQRRQ
jgi:NAD dependent epimerase/dehydratase family enzyme